MADSPGLFDQMFFSARRLSGEWGIDLNRLPVTAVLRDGRVYAILIMAFAVVWGGFPFWMLLANLGAIAASPGLLFLVLFPLCGLGLFAYGFWGYHRAREVTIDRERVTVTERRFRGSRTWSEPLSAYRGILFESRRVRRGRRTSTAHVVELYHDNPERRVVIHMAGDEARARAAWERACQALNLPALKKRDTETKTPKIAERAEPIAALLHEGKIALDPEVAPPTPGEIAVEEQGDELVFTLLKPQATWWSAALFLGLPLIFVYLGFFFGVDAAWPLGAFGLLFEALFVAGLAHDRLTRRRIRLSRERLALGWVSSRREKLKRSLPTARIATLRAIRRGGWRALEVASDQATLTIGQGLSPASLNWLRQVILAKLAGREQT